MMQEAHPRVPAETRTMATRTTQTVVHFASSFLLPGFDTAQPAGDYRVDHDEETIESFSLVVWQRVGTFIHLPGIARLSRLA